MTTAVGHQRAGSTSTTHRGPHLLSAQRFAAVLDTLSVDQTVERFLVHRMALTEVLLTDSRQLAEDHFLAAAQLPRDHAYYGDHTGDHNILDPLMLLEACRQAGLYASHRYEGVPRENKFILTHLNFTRHDTGLAVHLPDRLIMDAVVTDRLIRDGEVRGVDLEMTLVMPSGVIGVVDLGLRYRSQESYRALRLRNRNARELESTELFRPRHVTSPAAPRTVGRHRRDNVVIGDLLCGDGFVQGVLRLPASHASMFDHAQDHVPGMVLAEAVRQLATRAVRDQYGWPVHRTYLDELRTTFLRFGELEPSTLLRATTAAAMGAAQPARRPAPGRAEPAAGQSHRARADGIPMSIEITQDGCVICTASAVVATSARQVARPHR
jgi:hypothetical protein